MVMVVLFRLPVENQMSLFYKDLQFKMAQGIMKIQMEMAHIIIMVVAFIVKTVIQLLRIVLSRIIYARVAVAEVFFAIMPLPNFLGALSKKMKQMM